MTSDEGAGIVHAASGLVQSAVHGQRMALALTPCIAHLPQDQPITMRHDILLPGGMTSPRIKLEEVAPAMFTHLRDQWPKVVTLPFKPWRMTACVR
jgi:hypothetical protein